MPQYRSLTSTGGRNQAGARALWRATGMTDEDFQKPIIAISNSFTQFVPITELAASKSLDVRSVNDMKNMKYEIYIDM